jgi:hypothetical protein
MNNLIQKIISVLTETPEHIPAKKLAEKCGTSISSIYKSIKSIKQGSRILKPIGIHSVKKGYILSEFASKKDDVELCRRLNGQRTNIFITASAASPHILKRWYSIPDKNDFNTILKPLTNNSIIIKKGANLLSIKSKIKL